MATVNELIGQSLLRLTGGVLTSDSTVRWGEAKRYLIMAANYVQLGNYWAESKSEGERTINPTLLQAFDNIPVLYSDDRTQNYSDLPKRVLSISKGRALEMNTRCNKRMIPLGQGDDATEEYYGRFKKVISYQIEGQRVWYWNMTRLVEAVRAKYLVHLADLDDEDEILLPSDSEVKVLDLMHAWLSGEEKEPVDTTTDGKDN